MCPTVPVSGCPCLCPAAPTAARAVSTRRPGISSTASPGEAQIQQILKLLDRSYIRGLSLLGGEPFEPANQRALLPLLRRTRNELPGKTIWCYSGYTLDGELWQPSRARCEATDEMLSLLDVLVDGEFVAAQKDLSLRFRGSANQRIIDVPKSLAARQVVLWDGAMTVEPITAR